MKEDLLRKLGGRHPRVLVAGGAGFLGTNLSRELLKRGFYVFVLDNFSSGEREDFKELCSRKRFKFLACDINDRFPPEVQEEPLDFVFHLARLEVRSEDQISPLSTLLTNALGTKNLLDLTKKNRARFLLASAIDVFGETFLIGESDLNPFAEAKRFAEALVWEYAEQFDLNARVVRLAEVYGPGMDLASSGTLGGLLKELLAGDDLTVYGEGLRKEYYVYIDDAVRGLSGGMFGSRTSKKVIFVSPREPVTTLELAYLVRDASPLRTRINFRPGSEPLSITLPLTDRQDRERFLEGDMSLADGIRDTVESMQDICTIPRFEDSVGPDPEPSKPLVLHQFSGFEQGRGWALGKWAVVRGLITDREFSLRSWLRRKLGFFVVLATLLVICSVPVARFLIFRSKAVNAFEVGRQRFYVFDLEAVEEGGQEVQQYSKNAEWGLKPTSWICNLAGCEGWVQQEMRDLRILRYFSSFLVYGSRAAVPIKEQLRTGGFERSLTETDLLHMDLNRAYQMLLMAQAEVVESEREWVIFIAWSKEVLSFLETFLESPEDFSSPSALRGELTRHGFRL